MADDRFGSTLISESGGTGAIPMIEPQQAYTYNRYFELRIDPIDLCDYFGYSLALKEEKHIEQGINSFRSPADLEAIVRSLVQALQPIV